MPKAAKAQKVRVEEKPAQGASAQGGPSVQSSLSNTV
jgi:hypothetical protein